MNMISLYLKVKRGNPNALEAVSNWEKTARGMTDLVGDIKEMAAVYTVGIIAMIGMPTIIIGIDGFRGIWFALGAFLLVAVVCVLGYCYLRYHPKSNMHEPFEFAQAVSELERRQSGVFGYNSNSGLDTFRLATDQLFDEEIISLLRLQKKNQAHPIKAVGDILEKQRADLCRRFEASERVFGSETLFASRIMAILAAYSATQSK